MNLRLAYFNAQKLKRMLQLERSIKSMWNIPCFTYFNFFLYQTTKILGDKNLDKTEFILKKAHF